MPSDKGQDNSGRIIAAPCASPNSNDDVVAAETDLGYQAASPVQGNFPELMTESELIQYLRIPELSSSKSHHNVIEHLKRFRGLPRIHICNKALYPKRAIQSWIDEQTSKED
jgi:hypothetical protein